MACFTHAFRLNAIVEEIAKFLGHKEMTIEVGPYYFALVTTAVLKIIESPASRTFFNKKSKTGLACLLKTKQ